MSSQIATLGSYKFRINPDTIFWDYSIKVAEFKCLGGKVVQVLGASLGNMQVSGSFGVGGWKEQQAFINAVGAMVDKQVVADSSGKDNGQPIHFKYPPNGWDFLVYVTSVRQKDSGSAIRWSPTDVAPGYDITMFIVEDNAGLKTIAKDAYLARLAAGIGWKQTSYNGPMTAEEQASNLNGESATDYVARINGVDSGDAG